MIDIPPVTVEGTVEGTIESTVEVKLATLTFAGLYCYSDARTMNFTETQVIKVIGHGKSVIGDIIAYGVYGTVHREPIINISTEAEADPSCDVILRESAELPTFNHLHLHEEILNIIDDIIRIYNEDIGLDDITASMEEKILRAQKIGQMLLKSRTTILESILREMQNLVDIFFPGSRIRYTDNEGFRLDSLPFSSLGRRQQALCKYILRHAIYTVYPGTKLSLFIIDDDIREEDAIILTDYLRVHYANIILMCDSEPLIDGLSWHTGV